MPTLDKLNTLSPEAFAARCARLGITIEDPRDTVLTLSKKFTPGDAHDYACIEGEVSCVILEAPARGGSVWGTDSGSVGWALGLRAGCMRLHASGIQKRWLARLAKLI